MLNRSVLSESNILNVDHLPKKLRLSAEQAVIHRLEESLAKRDNLNQSMHHNTDDFYGLPDEVKRIFKENRKIESLYGALFYSLLY